MEVDCCCEEEMSCCVCVEGSVGGAGGGGGGGEKALRLLDRVMFALEQRQRAKGTVGRRSGSRAPDAMFIAPTLNYPD